MGTLVPADATRDKRSMLNSQVAALEGCTFLRASISGARHLARTAWEDSQVMPAGAPSSRHTRSLVLPDSQFTYKKRPIRPKETTRRVRHTAMPSPSVPRALAATALARRLPLATPSRSHNWQHPRPCAHASRSRARFTGVHHGAAPVRASVGSVPLLENNCAPCYTFQQPQYTRSSAADQTRLAAFKTLAQPRGMPGSPALYILLGNDPHAGTRGPQLHRSNPSAANVSSLIPCGYQHHSAA